MNTEEFIPHMIAHRCRAIFFETLFVPSAPPRIHAAEIIFLDGGPGGKTSPPRKPGASPTPAPNNFPVEFARRIVRAIARDPNHPNYIPAARALYLAGDEAGLAIILRALEGSDSNQKATAYESLGKLNYQPAREMCERELDSPDEVVGVYALACLAKLGEPKVFPRLAAALQSPDETTRIAAAWAAGGVSDPGVIEVLETVRNDSNPYAAVLANGALAASNGASVADAFSSLRAALSHTDASVRYLAADFLGAAAAVDDLDSAELLIQATKDADPDVRLYAASSLLKIAQSRPALFTERHLESLSEPPAK